MIDLVFSKIKCFQSELYAPEGLHFEPTDFKIEHFVESATQCGLKLGVVFNLSRATER